jgi:hypothetical protein
VLTRNIQKKFGMPTLKNYTIESDVMDGMEAWAELNPRPEEPESEDEPVTGDVVEEDPPPEEQKET